ncbi:unnamed protein product [Brassicogethes aeneus]|uniref:Uncharacterized protein n=1 Tax=Brassicogethes aeneus TaxID=1431903 RepID=A0A9P0FM33_BRAAE|nr:unnamed protein product [Brassicogethes aeneus]
MISKVIFFSGLLALATARSLNLQNNLNKTIVVSLTGFEDVTLEVNQRVVVEIPTDSVFNTSLTAVYADCKKQECYDVETSLTLHSGNLDPYGYPMDEYEINLSKGFNIPFRVVPISGMFCLELNCYNIDIIRQCPKADSVLNNDEIVGCKTLPKDDLGCWPIESSCRWYNSFNIFFDFVDYNQ